MSTASEPASACSAEAGPRAGGPADALGSAGRDIAVAIALAAASFLVRLALDRWLRDQHTYTPAFAAVAIAGWVGSWRAGALCALLSFVASDWFFVAPREQYIYSVTELVGAAAFFLLSGVILLLTWRAASATRRMRILLETVQQADAAKAELLALLAHELRNPLAAMKNATHILQSGAGAAVQGRAVDILGRQVAHVSRLVSDLMDASRIQQGKITLAPCDVALPEILSLAVETVQPVLQARRQRVEVDCPGDAWARLDAARMVQVLSNLLHNASKFSPDGAVIRLAALAAGDQVVLRVSDPGAGIPPERLDRVFDTYVQLGAPGEGLGLGLSLVRRLVGLHGGTIRAMSDGPGQGATFEIRLPRGGVAPADRA